MSIWPLANCISISRFCQTQFSKNAVKLHIGDYRHLLPSKKQQIFSALPGIGNTLKPLHSNDCIANIDALLKKNALLDFLKSCQPTPSGCRMDFLGQWQKIIMTSLEQASFLWGSLMVPSYGHRAANLDSVHFHRLSAISPLQSN